jgi:hypothetical protein
LNRDEALRIFKKLNAEIEDGGRHYKVKLYRDGKLAFSTLFSRSSRDSFPTGTAHKIFRDIGTSDNKPLSQGLRDCHKGLVEYEDHLKRKTN